MTWRQIVDRSEGHIAKLAPGFKERVAKWYQELIMKKIPVLIYCSTRTPAEQDELFKKRPKVTHARGTPVCQSFHCYGRAVDAVPLAQSSTNGLTACWDDEKTYAVMSEIGEKYRLRTLSWEAPHFEDADFKDWRELAGVATSAPQSSRPTKQTKQVRKVGIRKP
jgi:hypothetical protein